MDNEQYIYDYYLNTVKPTVAEFMANKCDLRKGRLAAIVLDHVRDYRAIQIGLKSKRGELSPPNMILDAMKEDCPDAIFLRDVCNASKHAILSSNSKDMPRTLSNANQIKAEQNAGLFSAPFGEGMFAESNYVFIKFDQDQILNGEMISFRSLHDSINEVIKYWDKQLNIKA